QLDLRSWLLAIHGEFQQRPIGAKGAAGTNGLDPSPVGELLARWQSCVGSHAAKYGAIAILATATNDRYPAAAIEQAIPIVEPGESRAGAGADFQGIYPPENQIRQRFAGREACALVPGIGPDRQAAFAVALVAPGCQGPVIQASRTAKAQGIDRT